MSDICPETLTYSQWHGRKLIELVYHNRAWPHVIESVLKDYDLRRTLSVNSLHFVHNFLSLEHEAKRQIAQIGRYAQVNAKALLAAEAEWTGTPQTRT